MIVNKNVFRYIEYELFRYPKYLKELEKNIKNLNENFSDKDNLVNTNFDLEHTNKCKQNSYFTLNKLENMERIVTAVNFFLEGATELQREFFKLYYMNKVTNKYEICDRLHISESTFFRTKRHIVRSIGIELGIFDNT